MPSRQLKGMLQAGVAALQTITAMAVAGILIGSGEDSGASLFRWGLALTLSAVSLAAFWFVQSKRIEAELRFIRSFGQNPKWGALYGQSGMLLIALAALPGIMMVVNRTPSSAQDLLLLVSLQALWSLMLVLYLRRRK